MIVRKYCPTDLKTMTQIWNEVVIDGVAFPQTDLLTEEAAAEFFASQTYTAVAEENGEVFGLYILHPNNIGRCGHISNASYAVKKNVRGRKIGEMLVRDCLLQAKILGFRLMQFNAVVASNASAIHLYEKLGFQFLGQIPGGFLLKNGTYEDIRLYYIDLTK
ncbi:MAG: GNAT family N-acetyltransferase [Candidatus Merdivicinus sp.]|jgi:L-amino acid N-acyltransferase YncA